MMRMQDPRSPWFRRAAICGALAAGVFAAPEASLAASITLQSSGGGVYDYALMLGPNEDITFFRNDEITLSGLSGVTSASLGGSLSAFTVDSITSTSVTFAQTTLFESGFENGKDEAASFGVIIINSSVLTLGAADYAITASGGFTGTVEGPVATPVPEPSTWALALLGFAGLCAAKRFMSRKAAPAIA